MTEYERQLLKAMEKIREGLDDLGCLVLVLVLIGVVTCARVA